MDETTGKALVRKHKARPLSAAWFKRLPKRALMSIMERVDFVEKFMTIGALEESKPWRDVMAEIPNYWTNHDQIKARAVELTLAERLEQGKEADRERVEELVESLACWYDHDIYTKGGVTIPWALDNLFDTHDPLGQFVSPDGRDLAHLDLLRSYREQGLGVVYLCNHATHLDEFLVDSVLAVNQMGIPLFAAGANMMAIKSFAKVLMIGAYVVRRLGGDKLYLASLHNYCRAVSEMGGQQGIFLEAWLGGARSRDGSLRYPRRLVTLRGAIAGDKDVVIQPVAVSYSIVPEDLPLAQRSGAISWLRGMNPLTSFLRMFTGPKRGLWRSMENIYGRAYVTFPKPMLLSELRERNQADAAGMAIDEFVALEAIKEIGRTKKIMASQIVARGLMRARRRKQGDLAQAVNDELAKAKEYHLTTFDQEPDLEDFINDNPIEKVVEDGLATLKRRKVLTRWSKDVNGLPGVRSEAGLAFYATHGDRRLYSPTAKENIVVVGAGDWGFAFASLVGNRILEDKRYLNASVTLYDSRPEVATEMGVHRSPPGRFKEHRLPKNVFVTSDAPTAFRKASEVIMAVTSKYFAEVAQEVVANAEGRVRFIVATSGFDPETNKLPTQVLADLAAKRPGTKMEVYTISGPVTEEDLVLMRGVKGVLAGPDSGLEELASMLTIEPIAVATSNDPVGVELCPTLARVYSMWGGFLQRTGDIKGSAQLGNYVAAVSAEAMALAVSLGASRETFAGDSPAWIATFIYHGLSGPSMEFGRRLGQRSRRKKNLAEEAAKLHQQTVADDNPVFAYDDLRAAYLVSREKGLDLPILSEAYRAVWEGDTKHKPKDKDKGEREAPAKPKDDPKPEEPEAAPDQEPDSPEPTGQSQE